MRVHLSDSADATIARCRKIQKKQGKGKRREQREQLLQGAMSLVTAPTLVYILSIKTNLLPLLKFVNCKFN